MIRNWWRNRQIAQAAIQRVNGYNWAAGQLLRGTHPNDVETQMTDLLDIHTNYFDLGARMAIADWYRRDTQNKISSMYITQEMIDNFLRRENL